MARQIEIKAREYNAWFYVWVPFAVAPVASCLTVLSKTLQALLPMLGIFIGANFADAAIAIYRGEAELASMVSPLAAMFGMIAYSSFIYFFDGGTDLILRRKMARKLRTAVVHKRGSLAYRHIEDNETYELLNRVAGGVENSVLQGFYNLLAIIRLVVTMFSVTGVVLTYSPWAALVLGVFSVPTFLLARHNAKSEYKAWSDAWKYRRRSNMYGALLVGRDNVEERTMFGYAAELDARWHGLYETARKIELKVQIKSFLASHGTGAAAVLASGVAVGFLLVPFLDGGFSEGFMISLIGAITTLEGMFTWQLRNLVYTYGRTKEYLKDFSKFSQLEEIPGALDLPAEDVPVINSIEFRNVSFTYPGTDVLILDNISFKLEGTKTFAFVGINGAGKTTVIKLLTGLYREYEGKILINGRELNTYKYGELKAFFSIVNQDFAKFELSLRECIALGSINGTDEESIRQAIETIDLEGELARFTDGLDTNLGKVRENGTDVSGGQWQRIALARSLVSPAPVRVLDEPTAALDPIAERKIYEMFGRNKRSLMTVLITHRLGAARSADEILVIAKGKVAERGHHDRLMEQGGIYSEMFEAQRSWYVDTPEEAAMKG